ncbi:MAG: hypothetical protein ACREUU_06305, partial [Gammaproteobacteria bacterium]
MFKSTLLGTLWAAFLLTPCAAISDAGGDAGAAAPPPASQPETGLEVAPAVTQLEDEIGRMEKELGAYDRQLGEQMLSHGLAYQAADRHDKAAEVLNRALHLK